MRTHIKHTRHVNEKEFGHFGLHVGNPFAYTFFLPREHSEEKRLFRAGTCLGRDDHGHSR